MFTRVKTASEIEAMRESGRMLAAVLDMLEHAIAPGVSERELADMAARELKALGGSPVFKGYQGYPDVICISTNDKIVHGIPSDYVLKEGDITGLDFGVRYRGMVTDSARTVKVGAVHAEAAQLISVTKTALEAGIAACHDGVQTGDIGAAIQNSLATLHRYGIVRELVGHGVGHSMHEGPDIPNYGFAGQGARLHTGMTIAIEPMVTLGSEKIMIDNDGWTVRTQDGSLSAHFEHTILITDDGAEVLTLTNDASATHKDRGDHQ